MATHRFYSFVNKLYMSPIQLGIQTGHGISSLMAKTYLAERAGSDPFATHERVMEWAVGSPTLMVCEGGNVGMLLALEARLGPLADRLGLPWASFREDMESLGGIITEVGVLVPEEVCALRGAPGPDGELVFAPRPDADPALDFTALGGLPLTRESNPDLHELAILVSSARYA